MDPETKQLFDAAKQIEVKNFISAKAFEAVPDHLKPPKSVAVGMRWISTWKIKMMGPPNPKLGPFLWGIKIQGMNIDQPQLLS